MHLRNIWEPRSKGAWRFSCVGFLGFHRSNGFLLRFSRNLWRKNNESDETLCRLYAMNYYERRMVHALIWTVSSATLHSLDQHFFQFKAWERTGQIELGLNLKWWRKRKECDQIERGSRASVFDHNTEPNQHKIRTHNKTTTFLMTLPHHTPRAINSQGGQGWENLSDHLKSFFFSPKWHRKIDQVPDHACTPPLPNRTKPNRCDLHALIWTVSSATLHSLDQHFFQFKAWERTGQIELGLNLKWWRKRKECDQIERGSRASVFDHNTEPNQHKIRTHNKTTTFLMTQARSNKDLFTRRAGQLAKLLEQISNQPLHRSRDYS